MEKLLGILPYIYFFDEPVKIGPIEFVGAPDWKGGNRAPSDISDRKHLEDLITCFPVSRGLKSDKGTIRAYTYFLLNNKDTSNGQAIREARKAVTLLRYMLLRPDSQGLNDIETSSVYVFELPPAGNGEYRIYHGWINFNQEEWVTTAHERFYSPNWHADFKMISSHSLEEIDEVRMQFYGNRLDSNLKDNILLSMEWYNLSFGKYSFYDVTGRLIDMSIAFDTLFRLQENKLTLYDSINQTLGVSAGSPLERWSRDFYGKVRSATMHFGKPAALLYTHPEAHEGHLSFLWSAQRIFRECVAVKSGIKRNVLNEYLIEELTSNEVILKRLRKMGSFKKIKRSGALLDVWRLRQVYPVGDKDDIIWLGKILLGEISRKLSAENLSELLLVVKSILANKNDKMIGWEYYKLMEELKKIFSQDNIKVAKDLAPVYNLVYLLRHFAEFAGYALTILHYSHK